MADLSQHVEIWERSYDWSGQGDEWSGHWGDTRALWFAGLMPRIHAFVPAGTILEIAPGHGRWTQFLKDLCDRLVIVDLAERCIQHCRERFSDATNIEYHVNDGRSLSMVDDASVDFAFSFDSLVHAEDDIIRAYLTQLGSKLSEDGIAFIHHSNLGSYLRSTELARRAPDAWREELVKRGALIDIGAWRAETLTAPRFVEMCHGAGLCCVGQELLSWQHGRFLIDCISLVSRPGSRWSRERRKIEHRGFSREAARTAQMYAASSFPAIADRAGDQAERTA